MPRAGIKILFSLYETMLAHENGTRLGEDNEELHDMRVSVRRQRTALRILKPYYAKQIRKYFFKELRFLGSRLGSVRDLDVFMEKLDKNLPKDHDSMDKEGMGFIRTYWNGQRESARSILIAYLDNSRYSTLLKDYRDFLTHHSDSHFTMTPKIPKELPKLLNGLFATVESFNTAISSDVDLESLHLLRIEFKRLRYTLEFFYSVLEPEPDVLIKMIKSNQDHLGDLNDTRFAISFLNKALSAKPNSTLIQLLINNQTMLQNRLLDSYPAVWVNFFQSEYYTTIRRILTNPFNN
jgi:CHAD domain-containing protein